jgi:Flp pilus assembly pilin Flp
MKLLKDLWKEEDGMGVVEIILIIVVLIGVVVIFGEELRTFVTNIFQGITGNVEGML